MADEKRDEIYNLLNLHNDDTLVKPDSNPGDNKIYHLYSDGRITSQFGGWAYLQRPENDIKSYIPKNTCLDIEKFIHKYFTEYNSYGRTVSKRFGYVIVTYENAILIRDEMEKLAEMM